MDDRVDGILQQMARVLNSNDNFEMDDSFQLSFTQVRAPPRGSAQKRKMKPHWAQSPRNLLMYERKCDYHQICAAPEPS